MKEYYHQVSKRLDEMSDEEFLESLREIGLDDLQDKGRYFRREEYMRVNEALQVQGIRRSENLIERYKSDMVDSLYFPDTLYGNALESLVIASNNLETYFVSLLDEGDEWKDFYDISKVVSLVGKIKAQVDIIDMHRDELKQEDIMMSAVLTLLDAVEKALRISDYVVYHPREGVLEYTITRLYIFLSFLAEAFVDFLEQRQDNVDAINMQVLDHFYDFREAVDIVEEQYLK